MVSLKQKGQSGFTIVELLIVIVIIGILAGLVVTQILGATAKARDSERTTDLNQISNQLEAYYAQHGSYPNATQLGTQAWRTGNKVSMGDSNKSMYDPSQTGAQVDPYTFGTSATPAAVGVYNYVVLPVGCVASTDDSGAPVTTGTYCDSYTLATYLEATSAVSTKKNAN